MSNTKQLIQELLGEAGIRINGGQKWDVQVHNENVYKRIISHGSLGLGESYMDGWWEVPKLDEFFYKLLNTQIEQKTKRNKLLVLKLLKEKLLNPQRKSKSFEVGEKHYDLGNDLYSFMLDKRMVYTCGYWKEAKNLDEAQIAKLDLVCRKLNLKKGMKVLDLGCGWGGFAKYAAEKYGVVVRGVTVSRDQVELGRKLCQGLSVDILLKDYRDIEGKYDRILSIGLMEHIGERNYKTYFQVVEEHLEDDGLSLVHTIGAKDSKSTNEPWLDKYIFPNSQLPTLAKLTAGIESHFVIEDIENFGSDYDKTLMAWFENFHRNWDKLNDKYDERFYRMWKYYLLMCAGSFRARKNQLWQIVLSKNGVAGGYRSIR